MENNHIGLKKFADGKGDMAFYNWANQNKNRFPFIIVRRTVYVDLKVAELLYRSYEIVLKKPNNQKYFSEV